MSTIDDIVAFAEQRRPGLRMDLVEADEDDIAELEKVAGHPLPARFREMLRIMGMIVEPLRLADAEFAIHALIARYNVLEPKHDRRYILLAIDKGEMYSDYYIDCIRGTAEDGPIVRFDYETAYPQAKTVYNSLYEMVWTSVFSDFAITSREHHHSGSVATERPAELLTTWRQLLSKLGLRPPLDESPFFCAVASESAAVLARWLPGEPWVTFSIGTETNGEMVRLRETLLDAVPAAARRR
ncbi:SMI1/KNR4 family protein [Sorangium sp. So ce131]|uniref:SMI1/KNR4 family protein n=1 Tax=Sorangium sp. So ce131 TaxID=3133282 RepID=UPI003F5D9177